MNPLFEHSLAEFAWYKVHGAKRLLKRHGLRAGFPDAWYFELLHLNPDHHMPSSVRDNYAFLARQMDSVLEACPGGGLRFWAGIAEADIEIAVSAFWRIYDAVQLWHARLNLLEEFA